MESNKFGVDPSRQLGIVRLSQRARIPTKSSSGAAGLDLYPAETVIVPPLQTKLVHTDIAVQLPPGTFGSICNKSKTSFKGLYTIQGVIDNDYTGPLIVQIYNKDAHKAAIVNEGVPVAQLVVQPYIPVILVEQDYLPPTSRGWNAFGTTDFKNRGNYKMSHENSYGSHDD
jgi:dUTP pyrophosphatase